MGALANETALSRVEPLERTLRNAGFVPLARVFESNRATDVPLALANSKVAVVRSVERTTTGDHTAIATMISEGDFIWGAVVYEQREPTHTPSLIETFHISQLDQLVARLVELREACSEAG